MVLLGGVSLGGGEDMMMEGGIRQRKHRKLSEWNLYVRHNYHLVEHLPLLDRLKALAQLRRQGVHSAHAKQSKSSAHRAQHIPNYHENGYNQALANYYYRPELYNPNFVPNYYGNQGSKNSKKGAGIFGNILGTGAQALSSLLPF